MSANNYILIEKKKDGIFEISHRDYDTDKASWIEKAVSAELALEVANLMEILLNKDLIGVEYGIRYVNRIKGKPVKKQKESEESKLLHKYDSLKNETNAWKEGI